MSGTNGTGDTVREYRAGGAVLGHSIEAVARPVGGDWAVTVSGGVAPHVGTVSLARMVDGVLQVDSIVGPGHKDHIVGERFARRLAERTGGSVAVTCGIHYDNATRDQLDQIVAETERVLEALVAMI